MRKKITTPVKNNDIDIVIPTKIILFGSALLFLILAFTFTAIYLNRKQKADDLQQKLEQVVTAEKEKADTQKNVLNSFSQLSNKTNYDFAIYDSLHKRLYSYYIETLNSDYYVQDASNVIDSYYANGKYYKVTNSLPEVNKKLINKFLLSSFKGIIIDLDKVVSLENNISQQDRLLLLSDNPYYAKLLSLNYKNGWPQTHDDTYLIVRQTGDSVEFCDATKTETITEYFITKSTSHATCTFQFWVFDVNYQFTTYAEWTADRLLFADYYDNETTLQDHTAIFEKLKKDNYEEVLDESGEFTNEGDAKAFLKKYLHVQAALPKGWKYKYITGEFPELLMETKGISITIATELNRGDMCSFEAGALESYECSSKKFLATKYFVFTEFLAKGKTKEMIGSTSSAPYVVILVSGITTDENDYLDPNEKATIANILKSMSVVK